MSLTGKPSLEQSAPLKNDGFWPDLSIADLMSKYRIPGEYEDATVTTGLTVSVLRVNDQLSIIPPIVIAGGDSDYETYTDNNSLPIGEGETLIVHYEHAVFCRSKAFLLQQFNSLNRRDNAENDAKESHETEQFWLDESQASIAYLLKHFDDTNETPSKANVHVGLI